MKPRTPWQRAGRGARPRQTHPRGRRRRLHRLRAGAASCSSAATRSACSTACTSASGRWRDFRDRIELVVADVRDIPASALDGVDGVINLSGLSNDPTAEFDPEANWQMNAVATETLGRAVRGARHRALRVRLLVLALRRPAAGHARRDRADPAARRLRDLQALRRGGAARARRRGPVARSSCATARSTATSPRMRFDLVVNTFVKDALLNGRSAAARRRLDVAPAGRRARRAPTR